MMDRLRRTILFDSFSRESRTDVSEDQKRNVIYGRTFTGENDGDNSRCLSYEAPLVISKIDMSLPVTHSCDVTRPTTRGTFRRYVN